MAGDSANVPSSLFDLIQDYYAQKPYPYDLERDEETDHKPEEALKKLSLEDKESLEDTEANDKYTQNFLVPQTKPLKMPVHPREEVTGGSITDQVAKESKDSTASSHEMHQEDTGVNAAAAHKANPGPVHVENIGEPASKEELRKRAEELNK